MPENLPTSVKFHYVKANSFRVIHVDGIIGGITPGRGIFLSLFNERSALPKMIEQTLKDGTLGNEIGREGKEGLVREMEVGVILSLSTAEVMVGWLQNQIKILTESKLENAPEGSTKSENME